jgi:uncharacterized protein (TIGR02145 family)
MFCSLGGLNNSNHKSLRKNPNEMYRLLVLILLSLVMNCSGNRNPNESLLQHLNNESVRSKVMLDQMVWMTENLSIEIPGSFCQQDDSLNCIRYGRLYTWEAAKNGCSKLGDGWRLPTNEEWQIMAKWYGGIYDDSDDKGKSAYMNLLDGGNSEFNAYLGGNREANGNYERLGTHGFYWTSTEYESKEAWFYNFAKGSTLLNHHTGDKNRAVSVRCIKDILLEKKL